MFVAGARNLARGRGKGGEIAFQIVGVEAPAVEEAIRPQHQPAAEGADARWHGDRPFDLLHRPRQGRSEEHTSELQSLIRISYAVFCLKKTKQTLINTQNNKNYDTKSQKKNLL